MLCMEYCVLQIPWVSYIWLYILDCTTPYPHPHLSPGIMTINKPESVEYPWTGPKGIDVYPAPCFTRPAEFTLTWTPSADFRKNACNILKSLWKFQVQYGVEKHDKEMENIVPHEVESGSSGTPITNMAKVTFLFNYRIFLEIRFLPGIFRSPR